jgi:hypothetical protein
MGDFNETFRLHFFMPIYRMCGQVLLKNIHK